MLEDIIEARRKKLEILREEGINPYPARVKRTMSVAEAVAGFAKLSREKKKLYLSGRVMSLRDQGGVIFADIDDGTGKIQAVLTKKNLKDFKLLKEVFDTGDFMEVGGVLFKTKKGEKSIEAKSSRMAGKALRPVPSSWFGLDDVEERFRKRYLDIMLNQDVKNDLVLRSEIISGIRETLNCEGFMEVETPMLQPIPGGALARPFATHHNALDADFYLRVAPELYLKRLLVAGFPKVFEIGRNFRNEGMDREHNPEFTMIELYWAYQDYEGLMKFTEKLLKKFIPGKYGRITYSEAMKKYAGRDVTKIPGEKIDEIFKKEVRPKLVKPVFLTDHPKAISPLAKIDEKDPRFVERFQLIVKGTEVANAFSELNDPIDQRERMEEQERRYRAGDPETTRFDEDFIEAIEYGMPPAAGIGIGIDRLVSLITGKPVKEIIIFPTLRPKK
ncbi:MAG: OB-fold nucleic acid binding domain-containing protein [Patescibacteria group bacterium]|nr:OB-fold nucleic acid binding domain-containing protein [Patescibacteria group bacterium]MCL5261945.1 OB-fold nucleic acid binding domain-containing protein [Patescibacteria group bacterium]